MEEIKLLILTLNAFSIIREVTKADNGEIPREDLKFLKNELAKDKTQKVTLAIREEAKCYLINMPHFVPKDLHATGWYFFTLNITVIDVIRAKLHSTGYQVFVRDDEHQAYKTVLLEDVKVLRERECLNWPTLFCRECADIEPPQQTCKLHSAKVVCLQMKFTGDEVRDAGVYSEFLNLSSFTNTGVLSGLGVFRQLPNLPGEDRWDSQNVNLKIKYAKISHTNLFSGNFTQTEIANEPEDRGFLKELAIPFHRDLKKGKAKYEIKRTSLVVDEYDQGKNTAFEARDLNDWRPKFIKAVQKIFSARTVNLRLPVDEEIRYNRKGLVAANISFEVAAKKASEDIGNGATIMKEALRLVKKNLNQSLRRMARTMGREGLEVVDPDIESDADSAREIRPIYVCPDLGSISSLQADGVNKKKAEMLSKRGPKKAKKTTSKSGKDNSTRVSDFQESIDGESDKFSQDLSAQQ
jgi:hypothetical protein